MRGTYDEISDYLGAAALLLERFGVALRPPGPEGDLELLEDPEGRLSFELLGDLPGTHAGGHAEIAVREEFLPLGDGRYERRRYEYEILDRERDYRRAFHLHLPEWFERTFMVVVHEHCEHPVGHVACPHYEGRPVRDVFAGIVVLVGTWVGTTPDCAQLRCLE